MSDDSGVDRLRHWQIKDFPEAKRRKVIEAAQLAGKTVTDWLEPVIDRALGGDVPAVNRRVYPVNGQGGGTSPADALATVAAAIGTLAVTRGIPKATRQAFNDTTLLVLRNVRQSLGDSGENSGLSNPRITGGGIPNHTA